MNPLLIYGVLAGAAVAAATWLTRGASNEQVPDNGRRSGGRDPGGELPAHAPERRGRQGRVAPPRKVTTIEEYDRDEPSSNHEPGRSIRSDRAGHGSGDQPHPASQHREAVRVDEGGDGGEEKSTRSGSPVRRDAGPKGRQGDGPETQPQEVEGDEHAEHSDDYAGGGGDGSDNAGA